MANLKKDYFSIQIYIPSLNNNTYFLFMKNIKSILTIFSFIIISTSSIKAQENRSFVVPDSLKKMSFEQLEKKFKESYAAKERRYYYVNTYYKKARKSNDIFKIANGMFMQACITTNDMVSLQYTDSIINLTKNSKDSVFPAKGYILKSDFYTKMKKNRLALSTILEAEKYAIQNNNIAQIFMVKKNIAVIKSSLNLFDEALPLLKDYHNYHKSKNSLSREYLHSVVMLSNIYNKLKMPDSSLLISDECFSKVKSNKLFYSYFVLFRGVSYHLKKDYKKSNRLIDESISILEEKKEYLNWGLAYYFKGENILQFEKNIQKAKKYFVKADSLLLIKRDYNFEVKENYLRLIEITKNEKKDKEQLYYLNRLIEVDDSLSKKNEGLSRKIDKNYDTPHLLAQKETIISEINREKYVFLGVGFLFLVGLTFAVFYYLKVKKQKELIELRFNELMNRTNNEQNNTENSLQKINENKEKDFDLSDEITKPILFKLSLFEKDNGFLDGKIKQIDLAKKLDTNSAYLSKIINHYYNKNFSQYLNDLRIDYTVEKLKNSKDFKKYTIEAIAEEVGFSNTQSFSKAFYNKTGLQPSFFIKKLRETEKIGVNNN